MVALRSVNPGLEIGDNSPSSYYVGIVASVEPWIANVKCVKLKYYIAINCWLAFT